MNRDDTAETIPVAVGLDFDDFYRAHRDRVAQALSLTLGDPDLGAQAADEAMTRAVQRWSKVSAFDNPQGWTYRVGLNWAQSWRRRRIRERERPMSFARAADDPSGFNPAIAEALHKLSVDHRAVVVCRYYLDYSTEQTAAALDIAPGTVKSRLTRALDKLRTILPAEDNQ